MNIAEFDNREMLVFKNLKSNTAIVRRRCKMLLDELNKFNSAGTFLGEGAFALKVHEPIDGQNLLADYKSVLGAGRFMLTWSRSQEEIIGMVTFQREVFDKHSDVQWLPTFDIHVPPLNSPYAQSAMVFSTIPLDSQFGDDLSNAIFSLHLAILAALSQ